MHIYLYLPKDLHSRKGYSCQLVFSYWPIEKIMKMKHPNFLFFFRNIYYAIHSNQFLLCQIKISGQRLCFHISATTDAKNLKMWHHIFPPDRNASNYLSIPIYPHRKKWVKNKNTKHIPLKSCVPPPHIQAHWYYKDVARVRKKKQVRLGKSLLVCSNLCNDMDSISACLLFTF